jgi:hypothetical protein
MEPKRPTIFQSILVAVVILAVIVLLSLGLAAIGLPAWPFIFFLFALTTLAQVTRTDWVQTAVGGLIGLVVGMAQIIGTHFFGATVGLVLLAVSVLVILTLVVDGRFKYTNKTCLFILTAVSSFATFITFEQVMPIILSFLAGVALFGVIVFIMESRAKGKIAGKPA